MNIFADDEVTDEELLGAETALTAEASTSAVSTVSANSSSSSANVVVDDSSFHRMFEAANRAAFSSIVSDTKLNLSPMSQTVLITAHRLLPHCDELCNNDNVINCLRGVFVGRTLNSESDRRSLISSIHLLRSSSDAAAAFQLFVRHFDPAADVHVSTMLLQVWLRRVTTEMLRMLNVTCTGESSGPEPLTCTDQEVLFYVTGYIVRKLTSSAPRYKKLKHLHGLLQCLYTKEAKQSGHFVEMYNKWVCKQSRGGLSFSIPDVYLLVRELDGIFRNWFIQQGVRVDLIDKRRLQAEMLHSFMVRHYWNKVLNIAHTDSKTAQLVLNYIVTLFITVKAFSVAKKEKNKFREASKVTFPAGKPSQSLRGKMKKQ